MNHSVRTLLLLSAVLLAFVAHGQEDYEDMLANVLKASPGKDRATKLVELSAHERSTGHYKEAIEFAILGSSEAERHGLDNELGQALMELARAHRSKGDLDNAIGASLRATLVNGTYHSGSRTEALLQLAELYVSAGHPQKALEHLEDAKSTTAADRMDRTRYLRTETAAKAMILNPDKLEEHCNRYMEEAVRSGDKSLQLDLLATKAMAQARSGKYQSALTTEEEVLKLAIALDRPLDAGVSANNVAELHLRSGRSQEAVAAFAKGSIMVEDLPAVRLPMKINAAHAQAKAGNIDASLRLLDDARFDAERNKARWLMPRLLRTEAAVRVLQGDLGKAQSIALEALSMAEESRNDKEQAQTCDLLSTIFERLDLEGEARQYERKSRDIELRLATSVAQLKTDREAQLLRLQRIEREQMDLLNREQRKEARMRQLALDAENQEKQMALLVYEKQLEESGRREAVLKSDQATRELLLAQADLDAERQQRQIQELDNSRMLQSLSLTRMEAEKKEQERTVELLEKRNLLVEAESQAIAARQDHDRAVKRYSIMLAVAGALSAIWMFWAWRISQKKKRTIWEQNQHIKGINDELEEKNHNIQSSLGYAQTIQSAILPSEQDLQAILPDSFLLYKPLDTVSGDLPFIKRYGDRVFLAAIDCTGHGVPAAMMTFIAYYGLNELLTKDPTSTSAELLDRLHDHVKRTMEARGDGNLYNDGFDIGLCAIDTNKGTLSFAGAQLPLLHVRNGQVNRIKGDILPIGDGHFERSKGYKEHCLDLQNGDSLYLFSDGIIHQFGGGNGRKKFSLKQLTDLLEHHANHDLEHIKATTDKAFNDWKGDTHQTDDVLLIGLRYAA